MRKLLLIPILFLAVQLLPAQHYSAWIDARQFFNVFEKGTMQKLEHLPIRDWKVGGKAVAYINNVGQFKIFNQGRSRVVSENAPEFWEFTDNLMVFTLGTQLYVWEDNKTQQLGGWVEENFVYGDSMVAFYDMNQNFKVYYNGETHFLEQQPVTGQMIGENVLVYINNMGHLIAFYRGKKITLEEVLPFEPKFSVSNNTVAYIDNYRQFKIFHQGNIIETCSLPPLNWKMGDDRIAFLTQDNKFMVFDGGLIMELESQPPTSYEVIDKMVLWTDPGGFFKLYSEMETIQLESYTPRKWKADNRVVAWIDINNKLKTWYNGQKVNAANRVVRDFEVRMNVITSDVMMTRPQFFYNGTIY